MACFIVSATEAVIVTIAQKVIEKKEKNPEEVKVEFAPGTIETAHGIKFSEKLKWLRTMLWGGSGLLAFEHVWHGEVTPWFPFLTAMNDPADTAEMLHEMSTVGVGMALLVTGVWAGMVCVSTLIERHAIATSVTKK
ncbi:MAG: hypothetical protein J5546_02765 [Lachnospiraceae bacterium]|nr:hypothetical protein [Lachnospiraceae bacterium]